MLLALVASEAAAVPVRGGDVRVVPGERAPGCPGEDELVRAALALGTPPAEPALESVSISVAFDGDGRSLRALVRARGSKSGERELKTEGTDCTKLAEAVAVVVAVLLDLVPPDQPLPPSVASFDAPGTDFGTSESAAPAPPSLTPPVLAPTAAKAPPPPPPGDEPARIVENPSSPLDAWLRGEGGLAVGPLGPVVSPWLGGAAGLLRERWKLGLGGAWVAPRTEPFEPVPGTGVDLSLWFGSAEGCFGFPAALGKAWDIWACAQFSAGVLRGEGNGFDNREAQRELWLATGPRAEVLLRLNGAVRLRLALAGLVTLGKRTFNVAGYGTAFTTPPASVLVSLGPELVFF